jgi:hypothetical protein
MSRNPLTARAPRCHLATTLSRGLSHAGTRKNTNLREVSSLKTPVPREATRPVGSNLDSVPGDDLPPSETVLRVADVVANRNQRTGNQPVKSNT